MRIERKKHNLTIAEANEPLSKGGLKNLYAAQKAGYSQQELSDMLNGRRLIKACGIPRLANALEVDAGDLYATGKIQSIGRTLKNFPTPKRSMPLKRVPDGRSIIVMD